MQNAIEEGLEFAVEQGDSLVKDVGKFAEASVCQFTRSTIKGGWVCAAIGGPKKAVGFLPVVRKKESAARVNLSTRSKNREAEETWHVLPPSPPHQNEVRPSLSPHQA